MPESRRDETPSLDVIAHALPLNTPPATPPTRTVGPLQRRLSLVLVALLSMMAMWWGVAAGPSDAKANFVVDALCDAIMGPGGSLAVLYGNAPQPQGINIISTASEILGADFDPAEKHTAWEWYGNAGLRWTSNFEAITLDGGVEIPKICLPFVEMADGIVSNTIFDISKMISTVMISMYGWLTLPELTQSLFEPIDILINGDDTTGGLYDGIFVNFVQVMMIFGAIWMLWVGLIKKRSREAVQGAIWSLFAAAFAIVFLTNPIFFVDWANRIVSGATQVAFAATSGLTVSTVNGDADTPGLNGDICSVGPIATPVAGPGGTVDFVTTGASGANVIQDTNRVVSCIMYKALMYAPWATGQYGVGPNVQNSGTQIENDGLRALVEEKFPGVNDIRVAQVDILAFDQNEMSPEGIVAGMQEYDEYWPVLKEQASSGPYAVTWSGRSGGRTMMALLALFASAIAGAVIIIFAFYILLLKVGFLMLVLVAPLFLTLGVMPGFGRKIGLRWMETILGVVLKQIIAVFMLAILVGLYAVILSNPRLPWFGQIILIFAVGLGTIMYRKQFMNMLNFINLGGGGGLDQGNQQLNRYAKRAGAGAVSGTAGGVKGSMADGGSLGGFVTGTIAGAMIGSRTGRIGPRAAKIGGNAGEAAVNKKKRKAEREKKEWEKEQKRQQQQPDAGDPAPTTTPDRKVEPSKGDVENRPPLCPVCRKPMVPTGRGTGAAYMCETDHTAPESAADAQRNSAQTNATPTQKVEPYRDVPPASGNQNRTTVPPPNGAEAGGAAPAGTSQLPLNPQGGAPAGNTRVVVSPDQQRLIDDLRQRAAYYQQNGQAGKAQELMDKVQDAMGQPNTATGNDDLRRVWDDEFKR